MTEVTEHTNPISSVKILYILPVLDQMNLLMKTIPGEVTCPPLKAWAWDDSLFGILSWRLSEQRIPCMPCNMPSLKIGSQKGE